MGGCAGDPPGRTIWLGSPSGRPTGHEGRWPLSGPLRSPRSGPLPLAPCASGQNAGPVGASPSGTRSRRTNEPARPRDEPGPDGRRQAGEGQRQDDHHPVRTPGLAVGRWRSARPDGLCRLAVTGRPLRVTRTRRPRLEDPADDGLGCRRRAWRRLDRRTRRRHDRRLHRGGRGGRRGRLDRRLGGRLDRWLGERRRGLRGPGHRARRRRADRRRRDGRGRRRAGRGDPGNVGRGSGRSHEPCSQRDGREDEIQEPHGDDQACALSGGHDVSLAPLRPSPDPLSGPRDGSTGDIPCAGPGREQPDRAARRTRIELSRAPRPPGRRSAPGPNR